jgi:hypothetical protein
MSKHWLRLALVPVLASATLIAPHRALAQFDNACECKEALSAGAFPSVFEAAPVTGEPFSAVWTKETIKTLSDGSHITHRGHHQIYRDAQGRVRLEMRLPNGKDGKPEEKMVFVMDPVAHTMTSWMEGAPDAKHVASVIKLPTDQKPHEQPVAKESSSRPQPIITRKDLGSDIVDNVAARGVLVTTVVPVGRAGNDQPITKTHEVWLSDDLKLVLKQKYLDPREGERDIQLDKLTTTAPDPALFAAPKGYELKSALQTLKELTEKLEAAQQ